MASLAFDAVTKRFGENVVVDDVSFEVADGEFYAILGRSRCGKSTILRLVPGLDKVSEGTIFIGERDVTDLSPGDRDVAMFFQNLALYPNKKGYGNIVSPLKARKYSRAEMKTRVEEVASLLGITHLLDRLPATYSGGERQRVAIARAIVRPASVYLFDEPLSNLDAKVRTRMRGEFKRLQRDLGITTLYVTPDQVEAMAMADRIMVFDGGIVQQVGSPIEVYSNPANTFVAGFVGSPSMNLLRGTLAKEDGHLLFRHGESDGVVCVDGDDLARWPLGVELIFGVRPEDVSLLADAACRSRIAGVEGLGRRKVVDLGFGQQVFRILVQPDFPAAVGDALLPVCSGRVARLFDAQNGKALEFGHEALSDLPSCPHS